MANAAGAKCAQRTIEDNPCRTEGKTWVQQQVGLLVLTRGALALLAAGAAWKVLHGMAGARWFFLGGLAAGLLLLVFR